MYSKIGLKIVVLAVMVGLAWLLTGCGYILPATPVVVFECVPSSPRVGEVVNCRSESYATRLGAPYETPLTEEWSIEPGGFQGEGETFAWMPQQSGVHNVTLKVTVLSCDNVVDETTTISVLSALKPPVVELTAQPTRGRAELTVTFTAVALDPDGGSIVKYDWNFGDSCSQPACQPTGASATHIYKSPGTYTASVTVTDDEGDKATDSVVITVESAPTPPPPPPPPANKVPVANISAPQRGTNYEVAEMVTFESTGSYDPDGSIVSYHWDFSDGFRAESAWAQHNFVRAGTYTIALTVADNDGAIANDMVTIRVIAPPPQNQSPVARISISPPANGEKYFVDEMISFDGSGSYDPDGSITKYGWNFGDGSTDSIVTITHQYSVFRTYTVTLTVTDDDGTTNSITSQVTIWENLILPPPPEPLVKEATLSLNKGDLITCNLDEIVKIPLIIDGWGDIVDTTLMIDIPFVGFWPTAGWDVESMDVQSDRMRLKISTDLILSAEEYRNRTAQIGELQVLCHTTEISFETTQIWVGNEAVGVNRSVPVNLEEVN